MKNIFQDFQNYRDDGSGLASWENSPEPLVPAPTLSRNPFQEFHQLARPPQNQIPLDQILAAHDEAVGRLTEGYRLLVHDEAEDGLFQPDGDTIVRIYAAAETIALHIACEAGDIETFCLHALRNDDPDFFLTGPLGLYISALCNVSSAPAIHLDLAGPDQRIPLLGYRLPEGHTLTIQGNLNDLIGISLEGGHLVVNGNVGRYLGAGMVSGKIEIHGDAGRFIGEQMLGGEIHISGKLGGTGKPLAGEIHHHKRRIYPPL